LKIWSRLWSKQAKEISPNGVAIYPVLLLAVA